MSLLRPTGECNLRDYGIEGQFGQEKTFEEFVDKLCGLFDDAKRALKKTGSLWVNLGDSYSSSGEGGSGEDEGGSTGISYVKHQRRAGKTRLPEKTLCLIPMRFAIEMVERGWILRNVVIWEKPNGMPSSVSDRLTVNWEYMFFFVKSQKYYYEQQFEKMANSEFSNSLGKNHRAIFRVPTQPSTIKHAAMYPEELISVPIEACTPEFICTKCGKPREKIFKYGEVISKGGSDTGKMAQNKEAYAGAETKTKAMEHREKIFTGDYTDCGCDAPFRSGVVLDPFMGTGTTGLVARKLGRDFIGFELSPENVKICNRINDTLGLFA